MVLWRFSASARKCSADRGCSSGSELSTTMASSSSLPSRSILALLPLVAATTSIFWASSWRNEISYPMILYFTGSCRGALSNTSISLPWMKPISTMRLRKPPWPSTFTIIPFSPVFKSDNLISKILSVLLNFVQSYIKKRAMQLHRACFLLKYLEMMMRVPLSSFMSSLFVERELELAVGEVPCY